MYRVLMHKALKVGSSRGSPYSWLDRDPICFSPPPAGEGQKLTMLAWISMLSRSDLYWTCMMLKSWNSSCLVYSKIVFAFFFFLRVFLDIKLPCNSLCLCLLSTGIKGMCYHAWPSKIFLFFFLKQRVTSHWVSPLQIKHWTTRIRTVCRVLVLCCGKSLRAVYVFCRVLWLKIFT